MKTDRRWTCSKNHAWTTVGNSMWSSILVKSLLPVGGLFVVVTDPGKEVGMIARLNMLLLTFAIGSWRHWFAQHRNVRDDRLKDHLSAFAEWQTLRSNWEINYLQRKSNHSKTGRYRKQRCGLGCRYSGRVSKVPKWVAAVKGIHFLLPQFHRYSWGKTWGRIMKWEWRVEGGIYTSRPFAIHVLSPN